MFYKKAKKAMCINDNAKNEPKNGVKLWLFADTKIIENAT